MAVAGDDDRHLAVPKCHDGLACGGIGGRVDDVVNNAVLRQSALGCITLRTVWFGIENYRHEALPQIGEGLNYLILIIAHLATERSIVTPQFRGKEQQLFRKT